MNSFTLSASAPESCGATVISDLKAALLAIILMACVAGAVTFGFIVHSGLGLYLSLGVGALTVDPLRRWFSRDDSSRRE